MREDNLESSPVIEKAVIEEEYVVLDLSMKKHEVICNLSGISHVDDKNLEIREISKVKSVVVEEILEGENSSTNNQSCNERKINFEIKLPKILKIETVDILKSFPKSRVPDCIKNKNPYLIPEYVMNLNYQANKNVDDETGEPDNVNMYEEGLETLSEQEKLIDRFYHKIDMEAVKGKKSVNKNNFKRSFPKIKLKVNDKLEDKNESMSMGNESVIDPCKRVRTRPIKVCGKKSVRVSEISAGTENRECEKNKKSDKVTSEVKGEISQDDKKSASNKDKIKIKMKDMSDKIKKKKDGEGLRTMKWESLKAVKQEEKKFKRIKDTK